MNRLFERERSCRGGGGGGEVLLLFYMLFPRNVKNVFDIHTHTRHIHTQTQALGFLLGQSNRGEGEREFIQSMFIEIRAACPQSKLIRYPSFSIIS